MIPRGCYELEIDVDRDRIARYGLNIADVLEVAKIAFFQEAQARANLTVRVKRNDVPAFVVNR